jgi:hypothetical protein
MLGEIGFRLGRKALSEVATVAQPDTILEWHRRLIARKFEGSRACRVRGRPRIDREVEGLIIRVAEENRSWGYDRIAGALANLGHKVSDQTVGNVLRRHGIPPAPERKRRATWAEFIRIHLALLAGTDISAAEALSVSRLCSGRNERNSTRAMMQDHRIMIETCRAPRRRSVGDVAGHQGRRRKMGRDLHGRCYASKSDIRNVMLCGARRLPGCCAGPQPSRSPPHLMKRIQPARPIAHQITGFDKHRERLSRSLSPHAPKTHHAPPLSRRAAFCAKTLQHEGQRLSGLPREHLDQLRLGDHQLG